MHGVLIRRENRDTQTEVKQHVMTEAEIRVMLSQPSGPKIDGSYQKPGETGCKKLRRGLFEYIIAVNSGLVNSATTPSPACASKAGLWLCSLSVFCSPGLSSITSGIVRNLKIIQNTEKLSFCF